MARAAILILTFTATLLFGTYSANARYLRDDGDIRQLYLCYFVADKIGDNESADMFLAKADYRSLTMGWTPAELQFYKGYTLGKNERLLDRGMDELADLYVDLACDLFITVPFVTRDE